MVGTGFCAGFDVYIRCYGPGSMVASLMNRLFSVGFGEWADDAKGLITNNGDLFRQNGTMIDRLCHVDGHIISTHEVMNIQDICDVQSGYFLVRRNKARGVEHCVCVNGNRIERIF